MILTKNFIIAVSFNFIIVKNRRKLAKNTLFQSKIFGKKPGYSKRVKKRGISNYSHLSLEIFRTSLIKGKNLTLGLWVIYKV